MAQVQTKTFWRVVTPASIGTELAAVQAEVNAFCASFAQASNVLDIQYVTAPRSDSSWFVYIANVTFLEVTP